MVAHPTAGTEPDMKLSPHPAPEYTGCCHQYHDDYHYFAAPFALVADQFRLLDHWIRARIRSMKFKGISRGYNRRWPNKLIVRLGLVSLYGLRT